MTKTPGSRRFGDILPLTAMIGVGLALRELIARAREEDLSGQVALITGGSRGLGLAVARELAGEGCRLTICARDVDELERAASELERAGAEVLAITCDVANEQDVQTMVDQVMARYGRIDLLITNAGVIEVGRFVRQDVADFKQAMDIMFWGTLHPILAVLPGMRARKHGRIATITSIGGKISVPHLLPYSAAKFAAVGLSEGLSAELADDGITVTTIVPGLMRTGSHLHAQFKGDEARQRDEYEWFAIGATNPFVPRADRAARIIVRALKRGEAERTFTLPFDLASRFHGAAPATTIRLMRLMDALLPKGDVAEADNVKVPGMEVERRIDSPAWKRVTALGREAAEAFNETSGSSPSTPPTGK